MTKINLIFIERFIDGEEKEIKTVERFCYSYIYKFTKDDDITKDIVSVALDKIIGALANYNCNKGRGSIETNFKKWIKTISYNTYLDFRSKKARELTFTELACAMGLSDDAKVVIEKNFNALDELLSINAYIKYPAKGNPLWNLAVKDVINVFMKIKDSRKRVAIILKFVYGLTTKEVSEIMRENFDAIQSTLHRSKKELKGLLLKKGIDAGYLDSNSWRIKHITK